MDRFGIFAANNVDLGDAFAETLVITRQPKPTPKKKARSGDRHTPVASVEAELTESDHDQESNVECGENSYSPAPTPTPDLRVKGGKAAAGVPISASYGPDDARLIELKQQGFTDEYVAKKLADEGRVRYHPRTIAGRWLRIKVAVEAQADEELDDQLSDWHIGEDEVLHACVKTAEEDIEVDIAKFRARKWKEVSSLMARQLRVRKYTAKACEERFAAVENGQALVPIEIDSDQEGRARIRAERIAAAKTTRAREAENREHASRQAEKVVSEKQLARQREIEAREAKRAQIGRQRAEHREIRKRSLAERRQQADNLARQRKVYAATLAWEARKFKAEIRILDRAVGRSERERALMVKNGKCRALGKKRRRDTSSAGAQSVREQDGQHGEGDDHAYDAYDADDNANDADGAGDNDHSDGGISEVSSLFLGEADFSDN